MGLEMSRTLGKTKRARSGLDWAEGAGWHQTKCGNPQKAGGAPSAAPRDARTSVGAGGLLRHGAAGCQPGPAVWAVDLGMWLQDPAGARHPGLLGRAGGSVAAGAVAAPVVERPGMGMGLEMWRDPAKHSPALESPALRLCWALLPPFPQRVARAGTV